jgi:small subunit ribosomal protein S18
VDYKDVPMLRKYMSDRGKIRSRRVTGNCAQHQRALAQAIKTARELVLLPYTQRTVTERPGGRRDRGDRGDRVLGEGFAGTAPTPVAVEVIDDTEAGDAEAEAAEVAEVEELVEEMAEDGGSAADGSDGT